MRVRALGPVFYGPVDRDGDPQPRLRLAGEEFELSKPEDFSFRNMEPLDAAARAAEKQRRKFEAERDAEKLLEDDPETRALKEQIDELKAQVRALSSGKTGSAKRTRKTA